MLNKNNALSFKVTNVKHLGLGSNFRLYCPKERNHHKMMIFKNGTTKDNLQYKDLCKVEHEVRIAYNNGGRGIFTIDNITNTMVEYPHWWSVIEEAGYISYEFEVLGSFFLKFNIKPTWINCNYTWGLYDNETDSWTGAVGQVGILTNNRIIKFCPYLD